MTKKYIHYGSFNFDKNLFVPISNRPIFVKPFGGMWASPVESEFGWKEWCESEGWKIEKLSKHFIFKLKDDCTLLAIRSNSDLDELRFKGYCIEYSKYSFLPDDQYYLDFEKLLENGIDAIEVYINSDIYWSLYGWDCDSLLVLNPDCVAEITK